MTKESVDKSPLIYARIAGLSYLITIVLGIFSVNFIATKLIVPHDSILTFSNILNREGLFRIGIASEVLMYVLVILLSLSLYVVLKSVNKNLALLALLWRLAEAIIGGATTVLSGLIPLLLIKGEAVFETKQLQALTGLFLDVRGTGLDIVLIFIGVGGMIFCYLFFKSRYVPRILATWGILTYLTMLILSFASILLPNVTESTKMIIYAPGGVFEIIFGLWLLIKGINIEQWKKHSLESAGR